jgi:adenine C2-methylase RlmN of 23S rRNA A2503 and tRNA A37
MAVSNMRVTITVTGKGDSDTNLKDVRNAVAIALRKEGISVATDDVEVTGTLAKPMSLGGRR